MKAVLFRKTIRKMFSPFPGGEKSLLVFCGLFLLLLASLFHSSGAQWSLSRTGGDSVSAVQFPDVSDSALYSKPLRSIERLIRNTRQGHCVRLPKIRTAALPPVPADPVKNLYSGLPEAPRSSAVLQQNGFLSSIFVRAGPFCLEFSHCAFQNRQNDLKEFYDERIFQEKYGIHHLLRFLCNSGSCRNLCLQNDFLRS